MSAEAFAKEAAQAIFLKENEAQICRQIDFPVGAFFRNICPDLVFYGLRLNAKKQSKVSSKTAWSHELLKLKIIWVFKYYLFDPNFE